MARILLRGCDSRGRLPQGGALNGRSRNACSICLQNTHERPFVVNPQIEQPSAERVFAIGGSVRYCPEHLYGTWRPDG